MYFQVKRNMGFKGTHRLFGTLAYSAYPPELEKSIPFPSPCLLYLAHPPLA